VAGGRLAAATSVLAKSGRVLTVRQLLTADAGRFGDEGDREVLLARIDRRRAELEQEAALLGRRFFQDSPRDFAHRLRGYWRTWRDRAESDQPDDPPARKGVTGFG
jgi:hypothetical protein